MTQQIGALTYHESVQKLYVELTVSEARLIIAKNVGLVKTLTSPFGKNDLNSLYAYVTGEYLVDPRYVDLRRTRPPRESSPEAPDPQDMSMESGEMRQKLVEAVKDVLRQEESYYESDTKALAYDPGDRMSKPFALPALRRLARFYENHPDRRLV